MSSKPPVIAKWLLSFFLNYKHPETMLADFEEIYRALANRQGRFLATLWYWSQITTTLPSFINNSVYWSMIMIRNYLTIALRSLRKQKGYSFINITGLALGMACTMLIMMWVQDELSYDNFHENVEEIYRVNLEEAHPDKVQHHEWVPFALAEALMVQYPEIINMARFRKEQLMFRVDDKIFIEEEVQFVDPSYFDIFSFPMNQWKTENALPGIESVVIRDEVAYKYFGNQNPLGKIMKLNNKDDFVVSGVVHIPHNSDLQADFFLPFKSYKKFNQTWSQGMETNWNVINYHAFVLLQKGSSPEQIEAKIANIIKENQKNPRGETPKLQKLSQIHLYDPDGSGNRVYYVYGFSLIAFFILGIACINFMNLSTARSQKRAKEVGLRKTVGARRTQLIMQFLLESILLSTLSFILAIVIVNLTLPGFNKIAAKELAIHFFNIKLVLGVLGAALLTGTLAGSYPAFVLSAFQPGAMLKRSSGKGLNLRKGLVVCQFALSIMLIICTAIVFSQLDYIKNKDIGYDKENIVYLSMEGESRANSDALKRELLRHPSIFSASKLLQLPIYNNSWLGEPAWEGQEPGKRVRFAFQIADFDFIPTFNIEMATGRNFSRKMGTDAGNFIINETAVRQMGLGDPIGKQFNFWGNKGEIIGVVKDFNFNTLDQKIAPLVISPADWGFDLANSNLLAVRIKPGNPTEAINHLENMWNDLNPGYSFDYRFLDDSYNRLYEIVNRFEEILILFTALAILISCLGLFGLASFNAERRTKEIGIRKVLGASAAGIVMLLSSEFSKLVLLSNIVAWPIAWIAMEKWLQNFAYRTKMDVSIFIVSAAMALVIALFTVSYQAFKAANANPVDALKYE
jgi:predicted permease